MADFTITVSSDNTKIIAHLARKSSITGRQLVEQKIADWCHGQISGFFKDKIRNKTTAELIALLGDIQ